MMKYSELIYRYPKYAKLVDRVDVLISSGSNPADLLPDAYAWIGKHIEAADRPAAREKLEMFCRLRGCMPRGKTEQTKIY